MRLPGAHRRHGHRAGDAQVGPRELTARGPAACTVVISVNLCFILPYVSPASWRKASIPLQRGLAPPCALHPAPYTLRPAPYTLHPAPQGRPQRRRSRHLLPQQRRVASVHARQPHPGLVGQEEEGFQGEESLHGFGAEGAWPKSMWRFHVKACLAWAKGSGAVGPYPRTVLVDALLGAWCAKYDV